MLSIFLTASREGKCAVPKFKGRSGKRGGCPTNQDSSRLVLAYVIHPQFFSLLRLSQKKYVNK